MLNFCVCVQLASDAALTMASTHHSRLKSLKYSDARFENACVEFDEVTMGPTYRLLWGELKPTSSLCTSRTRVVLVTNLINSARKILATEPPHHTFNHTTPLNIPKTTHYTTSPTTKPTKPPRHTNFHTTL